MLSADSNTSFFFTNYKSLLILFNQVAKLHRTHLISLQPVIKSKQVIIYHWYEIRRPFFYLPVSIFGDIYFPLFTSSFCATCEVDRVSKKAISGHSLTNHPGHYFSCVDPDSNLERKRTLFIHVSYNFTQVNKYAKDVLISCQILPKPRYPQHYLVLICGNTSFIYFRTIPRKMQSLCVYSSIQINPCKC